MKTSILTAIAVLGLAMSPAMAESEGNGNPFPYEAGSYTVQPVPNRLAPQLADTGSQAYPNVAGHPGSDLFGVANTTLLPQTGSETPVQTANSLPAHFEDGAVAYAQAISVQRWVAAHTLQPRSIYAASATRQHGG